MPIATNVAKNNSGLMEIFNVNSPKKTLHAYMSKYLRPQKPLMGHFENVRAAAFGRIQNSPLTQSFDIAEIAQSILASVFSEIKRTEPSASTN